MFTQDGWILASFFFSVFMVLDYILVHRHAKIEHGQFPAILTSHLVSNPYILTSRLVNNPKYGQTSPYRHLHNTNTISTTVIRTLSSCPEVSTFWCQVVLIYYMYGICFIHMHTSTVESVSKSLPCVQLLIFSANYFTTIINNHTCYMEIGRAHV